MPRDIQRSNIRQTEIYICFGSPTTRLVKIGQTHFIHPNDYILSCIRIISHTDHHRTNIAQRRVPHDSHLILIFIGIITGITGLKRHSRIIHTFLCIPFQLQIGKQRKREIKHIGLWPNRFLILCIIRAIITRLRQ